MKTLTTVQATIIIIGLSVLTGCSKSPESTIESFYRAVEKGEITEAKSYLSAQITGMLGDAKLSAVLSSESEKFQACGGINDIESTMKGEGELRSGSTIVTFNGECRPKKESVKLIKEDGNWKITASK